MLFNLTGLTALCISLSTDKNPLCCILCLQFLVFLINQFSNSSDH